MIPPDQETLPSRWDTRQDAESLVQIAGRITLLFLRAVIVPAALASVLTLFAGVWWFADLAIHFRVQYLVIGIIGLLPMLLLKRWALSAMASICIAFNFLPVAAYFQPVSSGHFPGFALTSPAQARATDARSRPVRLASFNVFYRNSNFKGVVDWLKADRPDVVILVEATEIWQREMKERATDWPYQHFTVRPGRSGKLVLSRLPILNIEVIDESPIRSPTPVLTLNLDGAPFRLAAVHTIWPMGEARTAGRDQTLLSLRRIAQANPLPIAAMGDFNISPFSPRFTPVVNDGVLRRAAAGLGWLPTWPVFFPAAGIQIDHLLISPDIAVSSLKTRSALGSDHRALIADLRIPASRRQRQSQRYAALK